MHNLAVHFLRLEHMVGDCLGDLRKQRHSMQDTCLEVRRINSAQTNLKTYDIGGAFFTVHKSPTGDHLLQMLEQWQKWSQEEEHGNTFVDRDPALFPLILHAIRHGPDDAQLWACAAVLHHRSALWREARYYNDDGLACAASLPVHTVTLVGVRNGTLCRHSYNPHIHPGPWQKVPHLDGHVIHHSHQTLVITKRWRVYQVGAQGVPRYLCTLPGMSGRPLKNCYTIVRHHAREQPLVLLGWPSELTDTWMHSQGSSWVALPRLHSVPPYGTAVVYHHNHVVAVGGRSRAGACLSALWRLTEPFVQWERGPDLPVALCNSTLAVWRGGLILLGGEGDDGCPLSAVWFLTPDWRWRQLPSMNCPRTLCAAYSVGGALIAVGGRCHTAECFDNHVWVSIPSPPILDSLGGNETHVIGVCA